MKILLRNNILIFTLIMLSLMLYACGSQTTQEGGSVTIQSSSFSEIKTIAAKVKAYLEVGGKTCEFELDPNDTTLKDGQKCSDIPMGSHSYKIVYKFMETGIILANTEGTITLISGKDNEINLAPPDKDIDDDGDGFKNYYEILKGTNPRDVGSKPPDDNTPPIVSSTGPANGAINVPVNSIITATFSEPFDTETITVTTFTVSSGSTTIPGTFSFNDMTVIFNPSTTLSKDTLYTVTITTGVKDLIGNPMTGNNTWSFTTESAVQDTTAPINTTVDNFINNGGTETNNNSVTLSISATDNIGVTEYYASENSTAPTASSTGWLSVTPSTSYSGNVSFNLSSVSGTKTVYVWFKDAAGNVSALKSDTISYTDTKEGLIAYYPFNGDAEDESGNGHHGIVNGGATLAKDRLGNADSAYSFDGVNGYISIANHASLNTSAVTVAAWIYMSNTTGNKNVVFKGNHQYLLQIRNGKVLYGSKAASGSYSEFLGSIPIPINTWTHVVITHDGTTRKIYVNGLLDPIMQNQTGLYTGDTGTLKIGVHNSLNEWFSGRIDEVRIYNRTLTESEINALANDNNIPKNFTAKAGDHQATISWSAVTGATSYNIYMKTSAGVTKTSNTDKKTGVTSPSYTWTGLTNGTTYYFVVTAVNSDGESIESSEVSVTPKPDDTTAPTGSLTIVQFPRDLITWIPGEDNANDNISNNHGALKGGTTFIAGKIGKAFSFDGVDDSVDLPVLSGVNTTTPDAKTTVEFWMYWNGGNSQMPIGWNSYDLLLYQGSFGFNTGNSDLYGISSSGLANRWVHVAAIFNNGSITANSLYIDGVAQTLSQRLGTPVNRNVDSKAKISGWNTESGYKFGGKIDEFKIYNRALSQEEIKANYNKSLSDPTFTYTNTTTVILDLSCTDTGGICTNMQFSNDNINWTSPEAYVSSKYYELSPGDGTKNVYVKFKDNKDEANNWTTINISDSIILDTTPPSNPSSIAAWCNAGKTALLTSGNWHKCPLPYFEWSGASDSGSGIKGYYVYFGIDQNADPATYGRYQTSGNYQPANPLTTSTTYYLRIKTDDNIGNITTDAYGAFTYNFDITPPSIYDETGLVASWHLDGGVSGNILTNEINGLQDASGNNNNGTAYNDNGMGMSWVKGRYNGAVTFDGIDDYINTGSTSTLNISGEITIEAWINPLAVNISQQTISSRGGGWNRAGWLLTLNNDRIRMHLGNGSSEKWFDSATVIKANEWTHIVALWKTGTMNLYVNGVKDTNSATWNVGAVANSSYTHYIGRADGNSSYPLFFKGAIDEVRIYNRALSETEIEKHYGGPSAGSISINDGATYTNSSSVTATIATSDSGSSVSQMKINEDPDFTGAYWEDYSPSKTYLLSTGDGPKTLYVKFKDNVGNESAAISYSIIMDTTSPDGTITINRREIPDAPNQMTGTVGLWHLNGNANDTSGNDNNGMVFGSVSLSGRFNQALSLDGVDDYVQINDSASLDITNTITIEAWINISSYTNHQAVVTKGKEGNSWGYLLQFDGTQSPYGRIGFYTDATGWDYTTSNVPTGRWVHIAVTYNGTNKKFYIDGILDNSVADTGAIYTNNAPVRIGSRSDGFYFKGLIDEVAIYDTALDAESIRQHYELGVNNADYTNSRLATIALSCSDSNSGCKDVQLSNDGVTWSPAESMTSGKSLYELPDGDGTKKVYVRYSDIAGNWTTNEISDLITLDTTPPSNPSSIAAWCDAGKTALLTSGNWNKCPLPYFEWSGATDTGAGIAGHYVYFGTNPVADPAISGKYQTTPNYEVSPALATSGISYYLLIKTIDNVWNRTGDTYQAFIYKFDNTNPIAGPTEFDTDLNTVGLWHFNESSGSAVTDAAIRPHNGTAYGTAVTTGRFGKARQFNGTGTDYVEIPDGGTSDLDLNGNQFTLEAWVNGNVFAGDWRCIIGKIGWNDSSAWSYNFHLSDLGKLHVNFVNTSNQDFQLNSPTAIGTGEWHYVAATYDSSTLKLYVDGVKVAERAASGNLRQNNYPVTIGRWFSSDPNYFNGMIDEVRISNIARSAEDILSYYLMSSSLHINNGNIYTSTNAVNIDISANDNIEVTAYYVSENPAIPSASTSGWVPYSAGIIQFDLSSGDDTKKIYIWFKDSAGNISLAASDTILLDTTSPQNPSVLINIGSTCTNSASVSLNISAADNYGVTGHCAKETSATPAIDDSCWTSIISTTALSDSVTFNMSNGDASKTAYVWYRDGAGNISSSASDSIILDTTPPTGTISINNNAATTKSEYVTLNLSAIDPIASDGSSCVIDKMQFRNDNETEWSQELPYNNQNSWAFKLLGNWSNGIKTVHARFKDKVGNISVGTISDDIDYNPAFIDSMENGSGNWFVSSNWTLVTAGCNGTTTCWTDSPAGNYAENTNASLTSIAFSTVGLSSLRLSFWQKYSLSVSDYAIVEISKDNGTTWNEIVRYGNSQVQASWAQAALDISAYIGNPSVKIRFRISTADGVWWDDTSDGWYIDNVVIEEAPISLVLPFIDEMERGSGNWLSTSHWTLGTTGCNGTTTCWTDSPAGNYAENTNASLTSVAFNTVGLSSLRLSFWQKYSLSVSDYAIVEISKDNGTTWNEIVRYGNSQVQASWAQAALDISAYIDNPIVKIRFRISTADGVWWDDTSDGWYIDDVEIQGTP